MEWSVSAVLKVDNLHKSFSGRRILRGVSFSLFPGKRLGLLGPNGAGKTTLIRCISGLVRPDSGSISLNGNPLPARGGRELLGCVPQEIALYAELSARENLTAFGRFAGLRGRQLREQVAWALQWTGLEAQANQPVRSFSGGMKRRINIACGVLHSPQVVLLDEPTVGVDPQSRQRIYEMLEGLRQTGTSLLLTTHHLEEAQSHCDSIVILDHGTVVAEGTLAQLIEATVGPARRVHLRFSTAAGVGGSDWEGEPSDSGTAVALIHDVASELPMLISAQQAAGRVIRDLQVEEPCLHHVFLHLTGHQLRDGSSI